MKYQNTCSEWDEAKFVKSFDRISADDHPLGDLNDEQLASIIGLELNAYNRGSVHERQKIIFDLLKCRNYCSESDKEKFIECFDSIFSDDHPLGNLNNFRMMLIIEHELNTSKSRDKA